MISLNRRMGELTLTEQLPTRRRKGIDILVERSVVVALGDRCECFLLIASIFFFQ